MMPIDFHELAQKELLDARDYYDELVFGLGRKFVMEIEYLLKRIKNNPLEFPVYFKEYRIALLRKFPFSLIFRVAEGRIYVLAVAHQKRRPKYYAERLD